MSLSLGLGLLAKGRNLPFRDHALALAFDDGQYRSGDTYTTDVAALPGYTYTRSGAKQELNATSGLTSFAANVPGIVPDIGYWSRAGVTNILLNAGQSTDLPTQSVSVSAVQYTLSFFGTGSITLSGAHAATLTGTGENDRVKLTFTVAAAGTLTLTVSGTVQYAGLVSGALPGPVILTTTAAASVGEDNLTTDTAALTDQDMLIWARGTPQDFTGGTYMLEVGDGTANNRVALLFASGKPYFAVVSGGVAVADHPSATVLTAGNEVILVARRLGGAWRGGWYQSGVLNWIAPAVTGVVPAGCSKVQVGRRSSGTPLRGTVAFAGIRDATFSTDAEVIAEVTRY